jgi:hypothetical protein
MSAPLPRSFSDLEATIAHQAAALYRLRAAYRQALATTADPTAMAAPAQRDGLLTAYQQACAALAAVRQTLMHCCPACIVASSGTGAPVACGHHRPLMRRA